MSLVPLADIFNHKAAVVSLAGGYQIQPACFGEEEDEDEAGASSAADSDADGARRPMQYILSSDHFRTMSEKCSCMEDCIRL